MPDTCIFFNQIVRQISGKKKNRIFLIPTIQNVSRFFCNKNLPRGNSSHSLRYLFDHRFDIIMKSFLLVGKEFLKVSA